MAKRRKINVSRIFQYGTRLFILALVTYFAVVHQLHKADTPNPHVFCPFGGLESLYKFVAAGGYIWKIFPATMILLGGTVLLTIVLNRSFCGWICPLGTLQAIVDKIARFFKIQKVQVPAKIDQYLSYIKYVMLVMILYFTWQVGELVYTYYDPWAAYTHLAAGFSELYKNFLIGSIFLLVALVGSIWLPHNFCRYFCPMGAFLSLLAKLSPTKLYRKQETCVSCQKCNRVCPVQIEICAQPKVTSLQCISCGDCVVACPKADCLEYRIGGKRPVHWAVYGIVALVLFFAPVGIAKQMDLWETMGARKGRFTSEIGVKSPDTIKGSMSLENVAEEFNIPIEAFMQQFNLPKNIDANAKLSEIAAAHNLRMRGFRDFIAEYMQRQ